MPPPDPELPATKRRGRRPGPSETRDALIDAARTTIGAHGYAGMSVRAVAQRAGVDPALAHHYFGGKEGLFLAAVELPFDPRDVIADALAGPPGQLGKRLVWAFLRAWDPPEHHQILLGILQSATADSDSASRLAGYLRSAVIEPLAGVSPDEQSLLRATAAHAQLVGLALERYLFRLEPLASAPQRDVAVMLGPALTRLLEGR